MDGDPPGVDGFDERLVFLVWDNQCGMSTSTPVDHVEDDVFVNKHQVAFHLLVELVGHVDTASIAWSWFGPLPTHSARVADLRDKVEYFVCNSCSFQEPSHSVLRSMPPSYV